jgi:hypothetical protein
MGLAHNAGERHTREGVNVHPIYAILDIALAVLSARSIVILGVRAPWTSAGWIGTLGYCIAAFVEYSGAAMRPMWATASYLCLAALTVAFVVAGVRDEPQAEPWWWPKRIGPTRAQRRG